MNVSPHRWISLPWNCICTEVWQMEKTLTERFCLVKISGWCCYVTLNFWSTANLIVLLRIRDTFSASSLLHLCASESFAFNWDTTTAFQSVSFKRHGTYWKTQIIFPVNHEKISLLRLFYDRRRVQRDKIWWLYTKWRIYSLWMTLHVEDGGECDFVKYYYVYVSIFYTYSRVHVRLCMVGEKVGQNHFY